MQSSSGARMGSVTLTFEVPNQQANQEGEEKDGNEHNGDHHPSFRATLLHCLRIHGGEELNPFLQAVHFLEGRLKH